MIKAGYYIPQDGCAMFGRGSGRIGEETVGRKDHSGGNRKSIGAQEWNAFYHGDMHKFISSQDRMGGMGIPDEWKSGYPMGRDPRYPAFPKSFTRQGGCGGTPYENQRRGYHFQRRPMAEACRFDRDALAELVATAQTGTKEEKEDLMRRHKAILTPRTGAVGRPLVGIPETVRKANMEPAAPQSARKAPLVQLPSSTTDENQRASRKSRDAPPGPRGILARGVERGLRPVLGGWTNLPIPEGYTGPEEAKRLLEEQRSSADAGIMPLSPFTGLLKPPPPGPSDGDASVAECLGRHLAKDGGLVSTPPPTRQVSSGKTQRPVRPVSGCDPAQWRSNYSASYY